MKTKVNLTNFIITVILMTVFFALPLMSVLTYESVFGRRYEREPAYTMEEFPGLQRTSYEITSDKGQTLEAYNYYREGMDIKAVVIIVHGFGGAGQSPFMPFADIFAQNGYYAFSYDATGYDMSEGRSMKGLSQGVIDLDHVISFVEEQDEFKDLPIMLFGHSWGAYCVGAVLNIHPEVTAVCALSGFNRSTDLFRAQGLKIVGPAIYPMMPYITFYDTFKFGEVASYTAMDGFNNTDADIMIIHSADDGMVPIEFGYDVYYEEFKDDPRFTFVKYEDIGHNGLLRIENREEFYQVVGFFDSSLASQTSIVSN